MSGSHPEGHGRRATWPRRHDPSGCWQRRMSSIRYPKIPDNWSLHPQPSGDSGQLSTRRIAGIRTRLHRPESADRGSISAVNYPPPIYKGQPFSVGLFSCALPRVRGDSYGFLADFFPRPSRPPRAPFRSLRAVLLSGLAPLWGAEVRKARPRLPSISTAYVLTVQAVG